MGNKFTRRRTVIDERYTRPQGLYQHRDVDQRKLRRLILDAKLAPCFPGAEDPAIDLDECPICFLFYPSLNRSKCCTKGICTECFLQIKSPHTARPTQCPFCKTPNYAVEFRGAKTAEEKGVEQAEEQKVIEAKIRIRRKELHDEEQRMLRREDDPRDDRNPVETELLRRNFSNLHGFSVSLGGTEEHEPVSTRVQDLNSAVNTDSDAQLVCTGIPHDSTNLTSVLAGILANPDTEPVLDAGAVVVHGRAQGPSFTRFHREDDFDLDLEDIMVMEAIWLSIQEQGQQQIEPFSASQRISQMPSFQGTDTNQNCMVDSDHGATSHMRVSGDTREVPGRSSVMGGLAGAIAALAEQQVLSVGNVGGYQIPAGDQSGGNDLANAEDSILANSSELVAHEALNENNTGEIASACATFIQGGDMEREQLGRSAETCETEQVRQDGGQELNSWIEVSLESGRALSPHIRGGSRGSISDWVLDHSSEAVEVGTSFSSSVPSASELPWEAPDILAPPSAECTNDPSGLTLPAPMLPESFEEQMMLAMALSLAEAQAHAHAHAHAQSRRF